MGKSKRAATKSKKSNKSKSLKKKSQSTFWKDKNTLLLIASVLVITIVAFYPSLLNDYVNWDDDKNFYDNPLVLNSVDLKSLIANIPDIFSTTVIGNYNPLTHFTFAIENVVFGLENIFWWHLDNLILHVICTFLVFRIALLLGLNPLAAALCALLFGIHPMRVESVAWLTERKDVLFGSFYLGALFFYIKGALQNKSNKYVGIILLLFILSGLSKIQAVSLPLSMITVDYLINKKMSWKWIWSKWFYFAISLAIGLVGIFFLQEEGSFETVTNYSFFQRLFIGSFAYTVYLVKLFIPYKLVPMYGYPPQIPIIYYLSMIPALAILALFLVGIRKKWKIWVFGIGFFTVNIVFLLQIFGAGQGFQADRFTYVAYLGLFYIISYYFGLAIMNKKWKKILLPIVSVYMLVFAYLTFEQNKIWKNGGTLWSHVLEYYPNTALSWGNRANYNRDVGKKSQALYDYSRAIALKPNNSMPYNSRAKLYFQSNSRDTLLLALQDYTEAIQRDPQKGEYYMNRGATYARLQDYNSAINDLNQAAQLDPENPTIYLNRSIVYNSIGQYAKEIEDINRYLAYNPRNGDMWSNRGTAYMYLGQWDQALSDINTAIQINPQRAIYYFYRARYYYNTGDYPSAQADLNTAKQLGFAFNGSLQNLAL